jgi:hypothetical protein
VTSTQTDARVSIGPVVGSPDDKLYALHIKQAHFHAIKHQSMSLYFENSTWYCDGGLGLTTLAYQAALFNTRDAQSAQLKQAEDDSLSVIATQGRNASGNPMPPPSTNSSLIATSTALIATIASSCAGMNLSLNDFELCTAGPFAPVQLFCCVNSECCCSLPTQWCMCSAADRRGLIDLLHSQTLGQTIRRCRLGGKESSCGQHGEH